MRVKGHHYSVLVGLAKGPLHGYGLISEISQITGGQLKPRAGSIYQTLDTLTEAGLVEIASSELIGGRTRKYYKLTTAGKQRLEVESHERMRTAKIAIDRLGLV